VAAEIAFLSMDLDYNGYCDNAKSFVDSYLKYSSDAEIEALLNFYKCYFACVRGKVIGFKINDKTVGDEERTNAAKTASYYFDLAYGYATRLEKPTLILVSGLMGTGKSVLAKNISSHLGAKIVRSDEVRKEILDIPKTERHYEDFGEGIYSTDVTMKTYDKTFEMAEDILKDGGSVIIDASFKDREQRVKTASMASSLGADFFVIECVCPDEILKGRLSQRMQDKEEVSDGRWEILEAQKKSFEKIDEFEERTHIVVDASFSPEECSGYAIGRIRL
jgi:hypothetical protein